MVSGNFEGMEVWEESKDIGESRITVVKFNQEGKGILEISKDTLEDFIEFLQGLQAKEMGQDTIMMKIKDISNVPNLNDWETTFIASISEQAAKRGVKSLSPRQLTYVERIYNEKVIGVQD